MMRTRQTGFSLVEVTIALAIAAAIGLFLMQQQETASKMHSKNSANQVIDSTAQVIQSSLANRATCTESLRGAGVGDQITSIYEAEADPTDFNVLIRTGKVVADNSTVFPGQIKIDSMQIIEDDGQDYLSVEFNTDPNQSKKMFGGKTIKKNFRLLGKKDGALKYTLCYSEDSNLLESSVQTACLSIGATWNSGTEKCELTNLPLCLVTEEACRGVFSNLRGTWQVENIIQVRRTCSYTYTRNGFPCVGEKSFIRNCSCNTMGCTCGTGSARCYSRTSNSCVDNHISTLATMNRCCQTSTASPPPPPPIAPGGNGGGGGGCFVAGTQVTMANGSFKSIEDVKVGEQLKDGAGKKVTVQALKRYPTKNAKYGINGGIYFFTANHPFLTTQGWRSLDPQTTILESPGLEVAMMKLGDILIRESGVEALFLLDSIETEETVYNFTVDGSHQYIADGYVVHNLKAPPMEEIKDN